VNADFSLSFSLYIHTHTHIHIHIHHTHTYTYTYTHALSLSLCVCGHADGEVVAAGMPAWLWDHHRLWRRHQHGQGRERRNRTGLPVAPHLTDACVLTGRWGYRWPCLAWAAWACLSSRAQRRAARAALSASTSTLPRRVGDAGAQRLRGAHGPAAWGFRVGPALWRDRLCQPQGARAQAHPGRTWPQCVYLCLCVHSVVCTGTYACVFKPMCGEYVSAYVWRRESRGQ
jgi:hypothetical protein